MKIFSVLTAMLLPMSFAATAAAEGHEAPAPEPVVIEPAPMQAVDMQQLLIPGGLLLAVIALAATSDSDTGT